MEVLPTALCRRKVGQNQNQNRDLKDRSPLTSGQARKRSVNVYVLGHLLPQTLEGPASGKTDVVAMVTPTEPEAVGSGVLTARCQ